MWTYSDASAEASPTTATNESTRRTFFVMSAKPDSASCSGIRGAPSSSELGTEADRVGVLLSVDAPNMKGDAPCGRPPWRQRSSEATE